MDAFDQGVARDIAKDNPVKARYGVGVEGLGILGNDDQLAAGDAGGLDKVGHIQLQGSGKENDRGAKGSNRLQKPVPIHALGNNADIILERKSFSYAGTENGLIISKDNFGHI